MIQEFNIFITEITFYFINNHFNLEQSIEHEFNMFQMNIEGFRKNDDVIDENENEIESKTIEDIINHSLEVN